MHSTKQLISYFQENIMPLLTEGQTKKVNDLIHTKYVFLGILNHGSLAVAENLSANLTPKATEYLLDLFRNAAHIVWELNETGVITNDVYATKIVETYSQS